MSRAAPFDPKAFLQARGQGRSAPAPPASPQILGVDSDDDFSNLSSSFATLGSVRQASPGVDDPGPSPETRTSPRRQLSPAVPDPPSSGQVAVFSASSNVGLPPGHTGHQTPDEVVQNQLFTGYAVPQHLPVAVGRRVPPPSLRRAPPPARPRPGAPPARTSPSPPPLPPAALGPVQPRPVRPPAFSRPRSGPAAVRPVPNPTRSETTPLDSSLAVSAGSRTPEPPWSAPIPAQAAISPDPAPPAPVRPPTRPASAARRPAMAPGRPNRIPIAGRPPPEPLMSGPVRPPAAPCQPLPAPTNPSRQPAAGPFALRASVPGGRGPPPVRAYRAEPMRRPPPAPFRPHHAGATPLRPSPSVPTTGPARPDPACDLVGPQEDFVQSEYGPDESTGYRSPSPLLLPAQSRPQGVPPAQRRVAEGPTTASEPASALFGRGQGRADSNGSTEPAASIVMQSSPRLPSPSRPFSNGVTPRQPSAVGLGHAGPPEPEARMEHAGRPAQAPAHPPPEQIGADPDGGSEISQSVCPRPILSGESAEQRVLSPKSPVALASKLPSPVAAPETQPSRHDRKTRSRFRDVDSPDRADSRDRSSDPYPAWFDRGPRRSSPSASLAGSITDERRQFFIQKAKLLSQRHREDVDALKQQIQKLKASQRAVPAQDAVMPESAVVFDDCLPYAFGENSRLVRRALEEQLDNNARMEAMLSKVTFILESGSYPESFRDRMGKASESRELKIAEERLASAEIRIQDLVKENEYLSKQLATKEDRIRSAQEESRVLIDTLRQSLEQETFERKRMNALYDEERHVLNASLRETIQNLAADNERLRVRLMDAGLPDD